MVSVVTTLSERRDHPAMGIATFIGSLILMSLISALVKTLSLSFPLSEILLFRFLFAMLFFWLILFSTTGIGSLSAKRPLEHVIRSFSGICSLGLFLLCRHGDSDCRCHRTRLRGTYFHYPVLDFSFRRDIRYTPVVCSDYRFRRCYFDSPAGWQRLECGVCRRGRLRDHRCAGCNLATTFKQ